MKDDIKFETFLFLSPKKLIISVNQKKNFKKVYYNEILHEGVKDQIDLDLLNFFLENNIFEIEKKTKSFIKNICLIIENNEFLTIKFSIKKNNYGNIIKKDNLVHLLSEAKDECRKTIDGRKIIHMIVDDYIIDEKHYSLFPQDIKCNSVSVDLRLICLSTDFIKKIESILVDYQVSISHILYSNYIKNFFDKSQSHVDDIFKISSKVIDGYNENEVSIIPKISNNKGFFERFFNFFN